MSSESEKALCPICGSALCLIKYSGHKHELLDVAESPNFCCFLGCIRINLHDKVVDGVNYRGKVFIKRVFHR